MYADRTVFPICSPRASVTGKSVPRSREGEGERECKEGRQLTKEESNFANDPMPISVDGDSPKHEPD